MIRTCFALLFLVNLASVAHAQTLFASRTISPNTILTRDDVVVLNNGANGAYSDPSQIEGLETRVALYPGRPIQAGDLGPPALVKRNGQVKLKYNVGGLEISTEGRSLDRAGLGDAVKVMNIASRTIVIGIVQNDGSVIVRQ